MRVARDDLKHRDTEGTERSVGSLDAEVPGEKKGGKRRYRWRGMVMVSWYAVCFRGYSEKIVRRV